MKAEKPRIYRQALNETLKADYAFRISQRPYTANRLFGRHETQADCIHGL